jgi:Rad3-related DNA helicase
VVTPKDFDLPDKFPSFRASQLELSAKIATSIKYAYLLDAPTGVGKSLIAATAQRIYGKHVTYICTTKQLQDQILRDFPYAKTVKGRNNYPCLKNEKAFPMISADECTNSKQMPCPFIERCPYLVAKNEALHAPLAVLNTAFFLAEANYVGQFSDQEFLVLDECDTIEDQLMSFIEVKITQKQLDRYELPAPKYKTKFESWIEWAKVAVSTLEPRYAQLEQAAGSDEWGGIDYRTLKELKGVGRLLSKLKYFVHEVDNTWVWYPGEVEWSFKPVWVAKYASGVLWDYTKKVLGMSATILDPHQICTNTGLTTKAGRSYAYTQMVSPFPVENRPVYFEPCGHIIRKEMQTALPRLAKAVEHIISEKHPNEKILIHTHSYEIRDYLLNNIKTSRFVTHRTQDRADVLESFKRSTSPLVLVSPSMDRGVDLPGDECRAVVIAKVPYPYLGDPQVNKRVHASVDGNRWYAHRTISTIIQMAGRGVRSATDFASTYILDGKFEDLYNEYRALFPKWFKDSIIS